MTATPDGTVRGFAAFPANRRRGARGRSWWARAWIDALEETSLATEPLRRGRRTATAGRVGPITISPGRIAAPVHGGADSDRDAPYATVVHVDRLSDAQWDRICAQVAARAGHLAALLDHDMPPDLADAAADADAPLLPGVGDLEPECDCDGWEHPCEHAAALCYQVAWLLDDDPFVLMLLRGRAEPELLDQLQRRNAALNHPTTGPSTGSGSEPDGGPGDGHGHGHGRSDGPSHDPLGGPSHDPLGGPPHGADGDQAGRPAARGVPARRVYDTPVPDLPAPPPLDDLPATPVAPAFVPGAADGIDPAALVLLATDAAARARTLLTTDPPPAAPADLWTDTVRLAAEHPGDTRLRANLEHGLEPPRARDTEPGLERDPGGERDHGCEPEAGRGTGPDREHDPRGGRGHRREPEAGRGTGGGRGQRREPGTGRGTGPGLELGREAGTGRGTADAGRLARAVAAWHGAGADGLAALDEPWTPRRAAPGWRTGCARAADALARARADGTWAPGGEPETSRNRWTPPPPRPGTAVELRFGRDGRWHPYRTHDGDWWPAGPPQADAADALAALTADPPGTDGDRR